MSINLPFTGFTLGISTLILLGTLFLFGTFSSPQAGFMIIFVIMFYGFAFLFLNIKYEWIVLKNE